MAYLFAGVSFVIGMAALYLASEAIKKVDRTLEQFLTTHLNIIGERLKDLENGMRAAKTEVAVEHREIERVKSALDSVDTALRVLNDELNRVRVDVQAVQRKNDPDPRRRVTIAS